MAKKSKEIEMNQINSETAEFASTRLDSHNIGTKRQSVNDSSAMLYASNKSITQQPTFDMRTQD